MTQPRRDIWTPIAGLLAAVTFVVGLILATASPDGGDSDAKVLAWYADDGHRLANIIGVYVLGACGLFFLWFAAGLRQRLRAVEGPGGRLTNVAFGGAVVFVASMWVGAAALVSISGAESFGGATAVKDADVARYVTSSGFAAILIFAAFGAIALIDATSIVVVRTGVLPRWFAWLGFVAAIVLLFGVVFVPIVALPVWLVAASILFMRLPAVEAEPVVAVPMP